MNIFGKNFKVITFGESHGKALGAIVDGCPAGIKLNKKDIQKELDRRKPGQSRVTTSRKESDCAEILSGVFEDKTLGTPICVIVKNQDAIPKDYKNLKDIFRPGHADQTWQEKFGHRDYRGGGRSSGRETIGRVIAGAIAKKILALKSKIKIIGHVFAVNEITAKKFQEKEIEKNIIRCADSQVAKEMIKAVEKANLNQDSLGGLVKIEIKSMLKSLGEPVFSKIEAELAKAILSIGAVRSFEIGAGLKAAKNLGSQQNKIKEGIAGGITTGDDITITLAVKPTPTIAQKQKTINASGKKVYFQAKGRHDPIILPRLVPVAEAMCALVLVDFLLSPTSKI